MSTLRVGIGVGCALVVVGLVVGNFGSREATEGRFSVGVDDDADDKSRPSSFSNGDPVEAGLLLDFQGANPSADDLDPLTFADDDLQFEAIDPLADDFNVTDAELIGGYEDPTADDPLTGEPVFIGSYADPTADEVFEGPAQIIGSFQDPLLVDDDVTYQPQIIGEFTDPEENEDLVP